MAEEIGHRLRNVGAAVDAARADRRSPPVSPAPPLTIIDWHGSDKHPQLSGMGLMRGTPLWARVAVGFSILTLVYLLVDAVDQGAPGHHKGLADQAIEAVMRAAIISPWVIVYPIYQGRRRPGSRKSKTLMSSGPSSGPAPEDQFRPIPGSGKQPVSGPKISSNSDRRRVLLPCSS